ncbi:ATP-binding cassette domain-containing protein, partial [Streptomyces salyersiae]
LLYAFLVVDPMTQLGQSVSLLQSGLAAAARIREIQELPAEDTRTASASGPAVAPVTGSGTPVLTFRDVHARYAPGAPRALNGVDLDIARRGHTAVVGPSGAGKTTLFSLVLRCLEPESGTVALDGVPLDRYALADLRERVVYVEQDTPLVAGTLRQN